MKTVPGLVCVLLLVPLLACKGLKKNATDGDTAGSAASASAAPSGIPVYTMVPHLRLPPGGVLDPDASEDGITTYRYDNEDKELLALDAIDLFTKDGWRLETKSRTASGARKLEIRHYMSGDVRVLVSSPDPSGKPGYLSISK